MHLHLSFEDDMHRVVLAPTEKMLSLFPVFAANEVEGQFIPSELVAVVVGTLCHLLITHIQSYNMSTWEVNLSKVRGRDIPAPPGYSRDASVGNTNKQNPKLRQLLDKKLWDIATGGKMQVFMSLFMMWLIGNTINIVMMFLVARGLIGAFKAIFDVNKVFEQFENSGESLVKYKLIYLLIQLAVVGIMVYKLMSVGILPTAASDWVDIIPPYSVISVAIVPS